jgi:hypothetical protein
MYSRPTTTRSGLTAAGAPTMKSWCMMLWGSPAHGEPLRDGLRWAFCRCWWRHAAEQQLAWSHRLSVLQMALQV